VVERAKIFPEVQRRQAFEFVSRVVLALLSPQQVHFRGVVQSLTIQLHRLHSALLRKFDPKTSGPPPQSPVLDLLRTVPKSFMLSISEEAHQEDDVRDPSQLLRAIARELYFFKQAVGQDLHDNCPEVEQMIKDDILS
jgi:hypothetical protein